MKELRFGAIDIGSNAARLLITSVTGFENGKEPYFKKAALVRSPLRLGTDSFLRQELSPKSIERVINSMLAYKHLMRAYDVISYRACATSAMRIARNSPAIVRKVKDLSGIQIEVITGHKEAQIVHETQIVDKYPQNRPYLYIDVGGGSTEITVFENGQAHVSRSFKIGTIRLLNNLIQDEHWSEMQEWVEENVAPFQNLAGIGFGGNISKMFKITKKTKKTPLLLFEINKLYNELEPMTINQRIRKYDMKTDRADVIIPAARIFRNVMTWANCQEIYVPKVGLADGLVRQLFKEYREEHL